LSYLEKALAIEPGNRKLRLARAWLLEQCGNDPAALAELESLADEAADSPRLLAHLATHFASAGRIDEAQSTLVRALERWPTEAALHTRLARLSWQRGAGLEAFAPLLRAIEQHPRELQLRLVAADQLRSAGEMPRALELLERGLQLAPDSATFRTSIGALLESMDRLDEALPMLRDACRRAPRSVPARRNLIPALLRLGEAAEARALCEALLAEFPDDQMLIAQRATALRLAGDPEYRRLFDYPRLVRQFALEPAAPYAHIAQFNQDFARELTALHRSTHHPLEQSLRGGSQTERQLPRDNPVIAAFFAMLAAPIRRYIDALGVDATHPVDRRRSADFRISGSWSVQLQTGGFHIDHVHPRGWLSSAYYVSLPAMADTEARAGWLKFGEPGPRLPACAAEHFVRPEAGTLVLFPSYMWHGTVPFTDTGPRLTAAFDVVPA
jgi:tetratricopeptide (TPR) repeat protein